MRPPWAAISNGSMKVIIGPTRPVLGSPAAFVPNLPIPSTGVKPFSMKNAVMKPQAMKAAMFGMIMPDRKVPNFCTATRAPPVLLVLLAPTSALAAMYALRGPSGEHDCRRAHRAPSRQVACRAYRRVACTSGSASGPIAYAAADIAIAPFLASLEWKPPQHEQRYCPGQAKRRLLTNSDTR